MFHDFWTHQDPQAKHAEMAHFTKNVALMGAAVALLGADGIEESGPQRSQSKRENTEGWFACAALCGDFIWHAVI